MGVKHPRYSKRARATKQWFVVRVQALRRDNYQCVQCSAHGRLEVDHIKPVRTHPELAYVLDNLQTLCRSCHTYKTREECGHAPVNPERRQWRFLLSRHETPQAIEE